MEAVLKYRIAELLANKPLGYKTAFAKTIGVTPGALLKWSKIKKTDKTEIKYDNLVKLAKTLNLTSIEDLLTKEDVN